MSALVCRIAKRRLFCLCYKEDRIFTLHFQTILVCCYCKFHFLPMNQPKPGSNQIWVKRGIQRNVLYNDEVMVSNSFLYFVNKGAWYKAFFVKSFDVCPSDYNFVSSSNNNMVYFGWFQPSLVCVMGSKMNCSIV